MAPAEGTPFRRIRMDDDLWERLDDAARRANPDFNRSQVIRWLVRWYVGDVDELPQRPTRQGSDGPRLVRRKSARDSPLATNGHHQ